MRPTKYSVQCRDRKHHIVYRTTNTLNGRFYIGVHSTDDLNDGYLGSGDVLKYALAKYGEDAFQREVLFTFDNRRDALRKEAEIVTPDFIARHDTYNLTLGGMGAVDQYGDKNPMYGRRPHNAKTVKAVHRSGKTIYADSIGKLSEQIGIARGNIRNLIRTGRRGYRGWLVTQCEDMVCSA